MLILKIKLKILTAFEIPMLNLTHKYFIIQITKMLFLIIEQVVEVANYTLKDKNYQKKVTKILMCSLINWQNKEII